MGEPTRLVLVRPPKPKRPGPVEFSIPRALARADVILAGPAAGHLPRVPGRGRLIQRFVLPLDFIRPQNSAHHRGLAWAAAAIKGKVQRMLWIQHPEIRREHLPGRPLIRAVRFSTTEPDAMNDGFKIAIDCLTRPRPPKEPGGRKKYGLNLVYDDAPKYVDIAYWWERARRNEGFGLLEVWSGTP